MLWLENFIQQELKQRHSWCPGLSKVAGGWQKSQPTWLVSAGYSAWHFFTDSIFLKKYPWTGHLLWQPSRLIQTFLTTLDVWNVSFHEGSQLCMYHTCKPLHIPFSVAGFSDADCPFWPLFDSAGWFLLSDSCSFPVLVLSVLSGFCPFSVTLGWGTILAEESFWALLASAVSFGTSIVLKIPCKSEFKNSS